MTCGFRLHCAGVRHGWARPVGALLFFFRAGIFGALDVAAVFLYRNVAAVLVCRWPEAGEAQGKHAHKQNSTRHLHSFIGMWNNKIHFTYS